MKKKLLITGSCGFIFSNFIRKAIYEKLPYSFVSIDRVNFNETNSIYWNKNHVFYIADIRDQHVIDRIFQFERPDIIIHGAASSHVDESLVAPNEFVTNNILGTQVLINSSLKYGVEKFIQISCYDEKTKAATRDGFKSYSELSIGDLVLSVNPISGKIEEKRIEKIIVQDYNGEMILFKNNRMDLMVTPNHRMIFKNKNGEIKWSEAKDMSDDAFAINNKIDKGKFSETINIKDIGYVNSEALMYVSGVFIGDGFLATQKNLFLNKSGYDKKTLYTKFRDPKTGRFISARGGPKKYSTSICYRIFFDVPEDDKCRKKLEHYLTVLNINWKAEKNVSGEHIYFSSKGWSEYFKQFGKYAKNKCIPNWMFDYNNELLEYLWLGIHDSDGNGLNIDNRNIAITTVSEKLTSQLCYLGSMIGYQSKIDSKYSISYIGDRKIEGKANVIYFSNIRPVKYSKSEKINYCGKIWCLKVADNKNFLVERNGKLIYSGNTDECYGQLTSEDDPSWTEEALPNPRNPYSASKLASELMVKAAHCTHGLNYNITRSSNNYGPRQTADKLIPKIIKNILEEKPIPIYGQGLQVRDWTHVFDNCTAIMTILEKGRSNEIYNISANQEFSNIEVVQHICNIMKKGYNLVEFVKDRPGHDFRYSVDSSKLKNLGWKPNIKFKDGIEQTIYWYINNKWYLK